MKKKAILLALTALLILGGCSQTADDTQTVSAVSSSSSQSASASSEETPAALEETTAGELYDAVFQGDFASQNSLDAAAYPAMPVYDALTRGKDYDGNRYDVSGAVSLTLYGEKESDQLDLVRISLDQQKKAETDEQLFDGILELICTQVEEDGAGVLASIEEKIAAGEASAQVDGAKMKFVITLENEVLEVEGLRTGSNAETMLAK